MAISKKERTKWKKKINKWKKKGKTKKLIKSLEDKEYMVRWYTTEALGEMRDKRAVQPIIKLLEDPYYDSLFYQYTVRLEAIEALGKIGDRRAVKPLIKKLESSENDVPQKAASALGTIRDKRAVEPLIKTLRSNNKYICECAAEALGEIGDRRAIKPLIEKLENGEKDIQQTAARSLEKIGKSVVGLLTKLLDNEKEDVRWIAANVLDKLGWHPTSNEDKNRYHIAKKEFKKCVQINKSVMDSVIKNLNNESNHVRENAAEILGKLGDKRAVVPLFKVLKDKVNTVRISAVESLGKIGDNRAVEPLVKLFQDNNSQISAKAAESLGKIGGKKAADHLVTAFMLKDADKQHFLWGSATKALIKIGKPAVGILINALGHNNEVIREKAAYILGEIGDKRAIKPLIDMLEDENKNVQRSTVKSLGKIGDKNTVKLLINTFEVESGHVKKSAGEALEELARKFLPKEVVILWDKALHYNEGNMGFKHDLDSIQALQGLCEIENPAISNILYKISQIEDISYTFEVWVGRVFDCDMNGNLSFEKYRQIASDELKRRNFSKYNPPDYFISDEEKRILQKKATDILKRIEKKG